MCFNIFILVSQTIKRPSCRRLLSYFNSKQRGARLASQSDIAINQPEYFLNTARSGAAVMLREEFLLPDLFPVGKTRDRRQAEGHRGGVSGHCEYESLPQCLAE
jgi:hypothetical protein